MKIVKISVVLFLLIAFSLMGYQHAFAQDEVCANDWYGSFSLELPKGYWSIGTHTYTFELTDDIGTVTYDTVFEVTVDAPDYVGQVYLRYLGLITGPHPNPLWTHIEEINPSQDTVFQVSWIFSDMKYLEARESMSNLSARIQWDGGEWVDNPRGSLLNGCAWLNSNYFMRHWGPPY